MSRKNKKADAATSAPEKVYKEISTRKCFGDNAVTAQQMKKILGWETEEDASARLLDETKDADSADVKFGSEYLLKLRPESEGSDMKVRCLKNNRNRPFTEGHARRMAQTLLNKQWEPNGESFIIGEYGNVLSGQHRGVGLILAEMMWEQDAKVHGPDTPWRRNWPDGPPVLETVAVYGVPETDKVLRTLDNVRPRTLADIFYTQDLFHRYNAADRYAAGRMLDFAIRLLWVRTGAGRNLYAQYRTHAESLSFLDRHQHLSQCIDHVFQEYKAGPHDKESANLRRNSLLIPPGVAAGLLYLMGCSASDPDAYRAAELDPNEDSLDWSLWDRACDFWVALCSSNELKAVWDVIASMAPTDGSAPVTQEEKVAVVVKAWGLFSQGKPVTRKQINLHYRLDEDGWRTVVGGWPKILGIDIGPDEEVTPSRIYNLPDDGATETGTDGEEGPAEGDPSEKEIEDRKRAELDRVADGPADDEEQKTRRTRARATRRNGRANGTPPAPSLEAQLAAWKEHHPDAVLLFRAPKGFNVFGPDAEVLAAVWASDELTAEDGLAKISFKKVDLAEVIKALNGAGHKPRICDPDEVPGAEVAEEAAS